MWVQDKWLSYLTNEWKHLLFASPYCLAVSLSLQMVVVGCKPFLSSSQNKPATCGGRWWLWKIRSAYLMAMTHYLSYHQKPRFQIPDQVSSSVCPPFLLSSFPCYKDGPLKLRGPYSSMTWRKWVKKKKISLSPYQKNKRTAKQLLMLPMTNLLLTSPTIRQCEAWFSCYLAKVLTRSSEILGKLNIFRDMCQASNADKSIWGKCNYS